MAKADAAAEEAEAKAAWLTKSKAVFEGPVGATPHPNPNPPPDPNPSSNPNPHIHITTSAHPPPYRSAPSHCPKSASGPAYVFLTCSLTPTLTRWAQRPYSPNPSPNPNPNPNPDPDPNPDQVGAEAVLAYPYPYPYLYP